MKILFRSLAALVLSMWLVTFAMADDLVPPPWVRGSDRTTTQEWSFDNIGDIIGNPIGAFGNPYGTPVVINAASSAWLPEDSSFNPNNPTPRRGVVEIAPESVLKFAIPNQEDLSFQKLVWAQVTWWAAPGSNVVISPLTTTPISGVTVGTIALGAGWNHTTTSYFLAQQPAFEEFWIQNFTNSNMYIDQVVIDTKCVPEPSSLAALMIGGLVVLSRSRRKRN